MPYPGVPGYEIVHSRSTVDGLTLATARRRDDGSPALIKIARGSRTSELVREYDILSRLQTSSIIAPIDLLQQREATFLLLEDPGRPPARERFRGVLDVARVLELGQKLTAAVAALHRQRVVHLNISPDHLLIGDDDQLTLTGFSVAHLLTDDRDRIPTPIGTPRYMAPEQTGLMEHPVDERADLYGIGGVLYEWLAGESPCPAASAQELMHAQLTRVPMALVERGLPAPLSRCVGRLLAKKPDQRYPSAEALLADLELCARRLTDSRSYLHPFRLHAERRSRLAFPARLYGREEALIRLATAVQAPAERVVYAWVVGHSGIGKSSLVETALGSTEPLLMGKCEQYRRSVPFAVLDEAISPWLADRFEKQPEWLPKLREQFGDALVPLAAALPVVQRCLPSSTTGCSESTDRVLEDSTSLVQSGLRLVTTLADREHPLRLVLDDLQWVDTATISWLERLSHSPDAIGITIIGAYRSEEVDSLHPLAAARRRIAASGMPGIDVELHPLTADDVTGLLADTLDCERSHARSLAVELHQRTQGNPFFLRRFCSFLVENRYLYQEDGADTWHWQLEQIRAAPVSADLIEFLLDELERLPAGVQRSLQRAATLGHRFTEVELETMADSPPGKAASELACACEHGLVAPVRTAASTWHFVHDRIHQAAYRLVNEREQQRLHLHIGRHMVAAGAHDDRAQMFLLVHHWNRARPLLEADESRLLARLDMLAARAARRSGALLEALDYARLGCELLPESAWCDHRALAFQLHREWSVCAQLANETVEAKRVAEQTLDRAEDPLERIALITVLMQLANAEGRHREAVAFVRRGLLVLDVSVPEDDEQLAREFEQLDARLIEWSQTTDTATLNALPSLTDSFQLALAHFLQDAIPVSFGVSQLLHDYLMALQVDQGVRHGRASTFPYAVAAYAFGLTRRKQMYRHAVRMALMAEEVGRAAWRPDDILRFHFLLGLMLHYGRGLAEAEHRFELALREGLRANEPTFLSYSCSQLMILRLSRGDELSLLREQVREYRRLVGRTGIVSSQQTQQLNERLIACYQGHTSTIGSLDGSGFCEAQFAASLTPKGFGHTWYLAARLQLLYRFGAHDQALAWLRDEARELVGQSIFYLHCEATGFAVLTLASARSRGVMAAEDQIWLDELRAVSQRWQQVCPANFAPLYLLASAELAAGDDDHRQAMALYQEALEAAERSGLVSQAALCSERAAWYHRRRGSERMAHHYLHDAMGLLRRWGAFGLVASLEARFGQRPDERRQFSRLALNGDSEPFNGRNFDLESILRASQAMSAALQPSDLLQQLMDIAALSSGADRCWLYLVHQESFEKAAFRNALGVTETWLTERPTATDEDAPLSLLGRVVVSGAPFVVSDLTSGATALGQRYFARSPAQAAAALPLVRRGRCTGVVYLESQVAPGIFTRARLHVLSLLSTQMAIAIDNAFMYQNLVAAQRAAESASRAKDQFLDKISHELRTPLNGVLGGAQLLQELARDQELPIDEEVSMVLDSGHELRRLIEDVLDVGGSQERPLRFDISDFDVRDLVEEVVAAARAQQQPAKAHIAHHIADGIDTMTGDRRKIQRILESLVGNAVKFAPTGAIAVGVEKHGRTGEEWLYFTVRDDGIGIAAHDRARIFEPFEQADNTSTRPYGGAGLGLSISQRLCRAMSGQITVESELGQGSLFTAVLPRRFQPAAPS